MLDKLFIIGLWGLMTLLCWATDELCLVITSDNSSHLSETLQCNESAIKLLQLLAILQLKTLETEMILIYLPGSESDLVKPPQHLKIDFKDDLSLLPLLSVLDGKKCTGTRVPLTLADINLWYSPLLCCGSVFIWLWIWQSLNNSESLFGVSSDIKMYLCCMKYDPQLVCWARTGQDIVSSLWLRSESGGWRKSWWE